MTDLATLVVKLEAQTAAYQQGLQQAQNQLKQFQGSVEDIFDQLKSVAIEFLGAAALEEFASSIIENEQELDKLSIQTGIAVDQLSKLQYAASQSDVSNFSNDILKLSKSVGQANDGNKQLQLDFQAIGVSASDLKTLSIDQILEKVANGFASFADGSGKAALSTQLLGRSGQDLTAFLDQGAAGIEAYMSKLDTLGGTVTPEAAEQAHAFGQALNDLKASLDGVGQSVLSTLLPALTDSTSAFATFVSESKGSDDVSYLGVAIKSISTAFLTLLDAAEDTGTYIQNFFQNVGKGFVTLGETATAAATGHFAAAKNIWNENAAELAAINTKYNQDQITRDAAYADAIGKIWDGAAQHKADAAAGAKPASTGFDTVAGGDIETNALKGQIVVPQAAAITALDNAIAGLKDKAKDLDLSASLDNTNEAMARVSLSAGKLAEDVKNAGAKGPALAAQYIAAAKQVDQATANLDLSKLVQSGTAALATFNASKSQIDAYNLSTGVLGKQVQDLTAKEALQIQTVMDLDKAYEALQLQQSLIQIDAQIQKLGNDTVTSAGLLFNLANQKAITNAQDLGDTGDLAKIDHLKDLTVAQAQYNDLQKQASDIQSNEAILEDAINRQVTSGQLTELAGQQQINDARTAEITTLTGVQTGLQTITDQYGKDIPDLITKTNQFKNSIATVQASTNQLGNTLRTDFIDDANQAWTDFIDGSKSASDALKEFLDDFAKQILQMADKNLLESLFTVNPDGSGAGSIFNTLAGYFTGGGGGGNLSQSASSALGASAESGLDDALAGLAVGGPAQAGTPYIVGENGPELMVPKTSGTVIPTGKFGGQTINQYISIPAPNGSVSKDTQTQVGAAASRQLQLAARRNN